jgi:hypothetical protein
MILFSDLPSHALASFLLLESICRLEARSVVLITLVNNGCGLWATAISFCCVLVWTVKGEIPARGSRMTEGNGSRIADTVLYNLYSYSSRPELRTKESTSETR